MYFMSAVYVLVVMYINFMMLLSYGCLVRDYLIKMFTYYTGPLYGSNVIHAFNGVITDADH